MKQCQMHISPAPECLVPCPEKATETVKLGDGMVMNLCKNHYNDLNKAFKGCCSDIQSEDPLYKELN